MNMRIWEVDPFFRCPIAMYCFTDAEQKRLKRKSEKNKCQCSSYQLHDFLMSKMDEESPFSIRMEKLLNQKYAEEIEDWSGLTSFQFQKMFDKKISYKTFGALVWLSAIKTGLTDEARIYLHGRIHMYQSSLINSQERYVSQIDMLKSKQSNLNERVFKAKKELETAKFNTKQRIEEMEREIEDYKELNKQKDLEIERLRKPSKNRAIPDTETNNNEKLAKQIEKLQSTISYQENKINELTEENIRLEEEIGNKNEILELMRFEVEKLVKATKNCRKETCDCPGKLLCDRRVLIVGGIAKLQLFYKQAVIQMGGELRYHDGNTGRENEKLLQHIESSDFIICPVDVNSHGACLLVKRRCKQLNKPYFMLPNSSVSSVYLTLLDIARGGKKLSANT